MLEINRVFLLGNLTRDPDVRYLPSGISVAEFDIAVNRAFKDKDGAQKRETLFIRVESMGKQAEFVSEYLKKGRRVYVEGRLRSNVWEGRDGQRRERMVVRAERIQFADLKPVTTAPKEIETEEETLIEPVEEKPPTGEIPSIDISKEETKTENDLPF